MYSRIKELRVSRRLSQEKLGRILGTTQQTISKMENNKYDIPLDILIKYSRYFNVTTDYILGLTDIKRSLQGQIIVNKILDEYYDFILQFQSLTQENRKTVEILMHRLLEIQDK